MNTYSRTTKSAPKQLSPHYWFGMAWFAAERGLHALSQAYTMWGYEASVEEREGFPRPKVDWFEPGLPSFEDTIH